MELRNRYVINSLIGFIEGMFVGIGFWVMTSGSDPDRSFVIHILASGLHGLIPCGAAAVYDIESWGVTKSTAVHAVITLITIIAIEIPMKWWGSPGQFAIALLIYAVIYVIIWLSNYLYWRHTVRNMNEQLSMIRKSSKDSINS